MSSFINKFDRLKNELKVGDIVESKIIKNITNNKAVADIKGFRVIVKSDKPFFEDSNLTFLISGFNEKDKTVLLKQIHGKNYQNIKNKLLNLETYIKSFLNSHGFPVNSYSHEIAHFLYSVEKDINREKFEFILKNLKFFSDIPFLYKIYNLNLNDKNIHLLFSLFSEQYKKKFLKSVKKDKNISDNNRESFEQFVIKGNSKAIVNKFKYLVNNNNLLNDLLNSNNKEGLLMILYPLIMNSNDELSYMLKLNEEKQYSNKLFLKKTSEFIFIKFMFDIQDSKLKYDFFYFQKENKALLFIDTDNPDINQKIMDTYKNLEEKINSLKKISFEIILKQGIINDKIDKLDLYG